MLNTDKRPVDGSMEIPVSEAGKILKNAGYKIANNEVDMLFFFRDPSLMNSESVDGTTLLRLCDVHNIPVATNITTAELLVKALERGDFDWKEPIITPSKRKKNIY